MTNRTFLLLLLSFVINSFAYINTAFLISNLQKYSHQDNMLFVCLQICKHNCLNILAGNICFHIQVE